MRRNVLTLLAAFGLALGMAQSASAADLRQPVYKAAPAPVIAAYNWSGFYLGIHGGYAWASEDAALVGGGTATALDPDGFLAGAQLGWNWQAPGTPWVFGIEGDWSWTNADATGTVGGLAVTSEHNWYATATARVGYAWDRTLWYVKGGAAWLDADYCRLGTGCTGNTRTGWTVGTGFEWALADSWTAKIEYNYMDFGNETFAVAPFATDLDTQVHAIKLGLNYRFPWGGKAPISARY
jgi:outer membrane immunogenic protein